MTEQNALFSTVDPPHSITRLSSLKAGGHEDPQVRSHTFGLFGQKRMPAKALSLQHFRFRSLAIREAQPHNMNNRKFFSAITTSRSLFRSAVIRSVLAKLTISLHFTIYATTIAVFPAPLQHVESVSSIDRKSGQGYGLGLSVQQVAIINTAVSCIACFVQLLIFPGFINLFTP